MVSLSHKHAAFVSPVTEEMAPRERDDQPVLDLAGIHATHRDFVWHSLQRLGVRDADLADMHQEVFVVVHRRLHTFDSSCLMTTWLFGICMRVATSYRRRAHIRREKYTERDVFERAESASQSPEEAAANGQARETLMAILDQMDLEKRAVFAMFEIDGVRCEDIATVMGVPLGTVYTRLRLARKEFERLLARRRASQPGESR